MGGAADALNGAKFGGVEREDGAKGGLDMERLHGRDRGMGLEGGHRGEPAGGHRTDLSGGNKFL